MRALLLLTAVFSLLTAYLEGATSPASAPSSQAMAKVIRTPASEPTSEEAEQTSRVAQAATDDSRANEPTTKLTGPLNLQLPSLETSQHALDTGRSRLMDVFDYRRPQRISYEAELVYDAEKGEDITGGKINIRIPLS